MKIYNSLTKKKEEFIPIEKDSVKMYACGITVYDDSHIGHARASITYDMICCYLRFLGYNVKFVVMKRLITSLCLRSVKRQFILNTSAKMYENESPNMR